MVLENQKDEPSTTVSSLNTPSSSKEGVESSETKSIQSISLESSSTPESSSSLNPANLKKPPSSQEKNEEKSENHTNTKKNNPPSTEKQGQPVSTTSPAAKDRSFATLIKNPKILVALRELRFVAPSEIQLKSIPIFHSFSAAGSERVVLKAKAKHGRGKTAAFVIGLLECVSAAESKKPKAIVLAPTRELALQIFSVFEAFAKHTGHAVDFIAMQNKPFGKHVLIGTPGSLNNQLRTHGAAFKELEHFCLDEADIMLMQSSFRTQIMGAYRTLRGLSPKVRPCFFSATHPAVANSFIEKMASDKEIKAVEAQSTENEDENIKENVFFCKEKREKYEMLTKLYSLMQVGQAIVFCETIVEVKRLTNSLLNDGYKVGIIYGRGMEKRERDEIMKDFRSGKTSILITTNLLARGIDVVQVNLVVNYGFPRAMEGFLDIYTYVHRVGRGGRFGRKAVAVSLVDDSGEARADYEYLKNYSGKDVKMVDVKEVLQFSEEMKKYLEED